MVEISWVPWMVLVPTMVPVTLRPFVAVNSALKVLAPVRVWVLLSKATLLDNLASSIVPEAMLVAFRLVRPEPLPLKALAVAVPVMLALPVVVTVVAPTS